MPNTFHPMKRIVYLLIFLIGTGCFTQDMLAKKKKEQPATESVPQKLRINYRYWDCQVENERGLYGYPENSITGFMEAILKGYNIVECDVAFSKDNVPVLSRSPKIDLYTFQKGYIKDFTSAELYGMDFGVKKDKKFAGTPVTTLSDILRLCKRTNTIVEINCTDKERFPNDKYQIVYNMVKKYGMLGSTIFYDYAQNLETLLDIDQHILVTIKYDPVNNKLENELKVARRAEAAEFAIRSSLVSTKLINQIHQEGFMVKIWSVNNFADMKRFVFMGADRIISQKLGPKFDYIIEKDPPIE